MDQPDYADLVAAAFAARDLAYTPYSQFRVGAAVLTASGAIFRGGNVENRAIQASVCAERVALLSAYAAGERAIAAIAVVTPTVTVASPCGMCRQVLVELAPGCTVVLLSIDGKQRITTPEELLPGKGRAGENEPSSRLRDGPAV